MGADAVGLSFAVNTDEITDDMVWEYESSYCTNCGSCGELGCKCWGRCSKMHCKYGDNLIEQYERDGETCSLFYDMLVAFGIENPYSIDLDRIKQISERSLTVCQVKIKDIVKKFYLEKKDVEEE